MKCIDDEIPFEIPQSWCWVRLAQVLTVKGGKRIPLGDSFAPGPTSHIYIRVTEMKNHTLVTNNLKYISDSVYEKIKNYTIGKDDLYLTIAGTIGSVGIVPEMFDGMNLTENAVKLTNILIDKMFLVYGISSQFVQSQFSEKTKQMAQPKLAIERILTTLIPLPPINEQISIVSRIEEIMPIADKYEKSQEALDKLNADIFDKLKKSVLQEAIQGKLIPQDPNDEPASILLERIKEEKAKLFKEGKLKKKDLVDSVIFKGEDNKYYETIDGKTECIDERIPFEIPQNWLWTTLGNLVQNCSGLAYKKENLDERSDSYIRVLRGGNIDDGKWSIKDDDVIIASKFVKPELILTAGTFITPAVTSIEQMGKTALVRDDQPQTVVGGFVLMLLPFLRDWSLLDYLELIFQSEYYKGYCRSITNKSGQAFYNLSRQKLMQFLVPLPPLNERIAIANEVAKINSMMR